MKKIIVLGAILVFSLTFLSGCLDSQYTSKEDPSINPGNPFDPSKPDDSNPDLIKQQADGESPQEYEDDNFPQNNIPLSEANLEIISNDDDIRYWDIVNYTIIGAPTGSNISWDFEDGIIAYGESVNHRYESSDYFTIIVGVRLNDEYAETSMDVAVKNRDDAFVMESTSTKLILGNQGIAMGVVIPDGITIPTSHLYINITKLSGELEVGVCMYQRKGEEQIFVETLVNDTIEGKLSDYKFEWKISEDYFANIEDIRPYEISCFIRWIGHVGHTEYSMSIFIEY